MVILQLVLNLYKEISSFFVHHSAYFSNIEAIQAQPNRKRIRDHHGFPDCKTAVHLYTTGDAGYPYGAEQLSLGADISKTAAKFGKNVTCH